jgi:Uma2 family endonuclease
MTFMSSTEKQLNPQRVFRHQATGVDGLLSKSTRRTAMNPASLTPVVPPLLSDYVPKLFTAADLEHLPSDLPSGPVRYELHHGRLITMPPPGDTHGAVEGNLITALKVQGEYKGLGKARCGEVSVILQRDPDHIFGVDAVFISNARLPLRRSPEGYLETIPELIVEVRSKNDTLAALERKAQDYLDAGAVLVWVVDPINRNVVEYRQGVAARTYDENDTLTVDDVIPGFMLPVGVALQE